MKKGGYRNLETPDEASLAVFKQIFDLLYLLGRLLLNWL